MNRPPATWRLETAATGTGAIAVIVVTGDVDVALAAAGIRPVAVGEVRLRSLAGVDTGIVARWSTETAHLMGHGGPAVIRALAEALTRAGIPRRDDIDPRAAYPEAGDDVEARMLGTLARAASPLAIDLLLDQPRRWRAGPGPMAAAPRGDADDRAGGPREGGPSRDRLLRRLIDPPLVVAIGAPNIGKSTLCNALAGRAVSIVADQPGTTRDHVGVTLDLAGLVVRYVDTPGLRESDDPIERDAARLSVGVASRADLILRCGDATALPPTGSSDCPSLTVALRVDRGLPQWPHDVRTSAAHGEGLYTLAQLARDTLVPPSAIADPTPWCFWKP